MEEVLIACLQMSEVTARVKLSISTWSMKKKANGTHHAKQNA